jgi:hypothetical protein
MEFIVMKPNLTFLRKKNKGLRSRSFSMYRELLLQLCNQHSNLKVAQEIRCFVKKQRWADLLTYADSLSSTEYDDAALHFAANQFASLIRKYPWDPILVGTDPEGTALEKWQASEHKCKLVNQQFRSFSTLWSPHEGLLERVRGYISHVIGETPNMKEIYELCDYTAGASVGVHGNATNIGRKLSSNWSVSPSAYLHYFNALAANPSLLRPLCEERKYGDQEASVVCWDQSSIFRKFQERAVVVTHNIIGFVPKTARTYRSIAVEPTGNAFVQKGIDLVLRKKLQKIGIDLSDQRRNQYFAKFGSEDWLAPNGFCTIDLSSASDSIALEMCRSVLPYDWFVLLNEVRSREYSLNGTTHKYEKFCSMGNGFCFPLESLIFTAICYAAGAGIPRRDFVVYGDDIIVRKTHFDRVIQTLSLFGFTPNHDKTFSEGPFRESCGADWYKGEDVRPYTLDHELDSCQSLFKFLNLSRRNARTSAFFSGVYSMVIGWIPTRLRLYRPISGPADSAIDLEGLEYIVHPLVNLRRREHQFRWYEILSCPAKDKMDLTENVRVLCYLRGDMILTLRRRKVDRIVRKHGG